MFLSPPASWIACIGLLSLAACAGPDAGAFDQRMATYVGGPEERLIQDLGVPQRVYEADGRRFLQFQTASAPASSVSPSLGIGIGGGSGGWGRGGVGGGLGLGFGFGGGSVPEFCAVTFEVRDSRVLNFDRRGDGCR